MIKKPGSCAKIRVDCLVNPLISFDLKTVGDARLDGFLKTQALKLDYDFQAAMYFFAVSKPSLATIYPSASFQWKRMSHMAYSCKRPALDLNFFENGMRKFRYALRTLKKMPGNRRLAGIPEHLQSARRNSKNTLCSRRRTPWTDPIGRNHRN
ncbi:PD-(D/E)XK nuclease-like domain-containing protein [Undibacterium arcticum]